MDLRLFLGVLGRHRVAVAIGVALALLLSLLSYVRPAWDGVTPTIAYREQETWQSQARVLVTLPGFSPGESLLGTSVKAERQAGAIQRAESRLSALALLYASLATGDDVRRIVREDGPIVGRVVAAAETVSGGSAVLPIVDITALAPTSQESQELADRYVRALGVYVARQQKAFRVPATDRVALQSLNRGGRTELVEPRGTTLPIIVFLTVLTATVGIAFVLENLGSRRAPLVELDRSEPDLEPPARAMRHRT